MLSSNEWLSALFNFFESGGWVLYLLLAICMVLFTALMERLAYRIIKYPHQKRSLKRRYQLELSQYVWISKLCDLDMDLNVGFRLIKTLILVTPLVGLLGTVLGMVEVFEGLAVHGTGDVKVMAEGVASATIPTFTGMSVSVVGLLALGQLDHWRRSERQALLAWRQGRSI
ncbi:MAG: MotA/TolQ/ExbB proton channel family protein [Pontibacterium sp.]